MMKIGVFGASSQIAKDLIVNLVQSDNYQLSLFSRKPDDLVSMISPFCSEDTPNYLKYSDFNNELEFDTIVNFVGVGDPTRAKSLGYKILSITAEYDERILSYISLYPECKYIFLSSGAVYGKDFSEPVDQNSKAVFNINDLDSTDWYSAAKFCAEVKHRAMSNCFIVDIRVFNYFSATQDFETKFLMSDIVQSILQKTVLLTSPENITRDFITPVDFFQLFEKIVNGEPSNLAIDAYTAKPIDKLALLTELQTKYGLKFEFVDNSFVTNATGCKSNYYSLNSAAERFGYVPQFTSMEGLIKEIDKLAKGVNG